MENAQIRMTQEIHRLGGHYAHVLDESIDSRHDDATGEAWLYRPLHVHVVPLILASVRPAEDRNE